MDLDNYGDTYTNDDGVECCDNCGVDLNECECYCVVCEEHVTECCCDEGPSYPAAAYS